jgi:hypothetical protein
VTDALAAVRDVDSRRVRRYTSVMKFEWDERKNRANYAKHEIVFELACKVLMIRLPLMFSTG